MRYTVTLERLGTLRICQRIRNRQRTLLQARDQPFTNRLRGLLRFRSWVFVFAFAMIFNSCLQ